jgi:hypothetical protein
MLAAKAFKKSPFSEIVFFKERLLLLPYGGSICVFYGTNY